MSTEWFNSHDGTANCIERLCEPDWTVESHSESSIQSTDEWILANALHRLHSGCRYHVFDISLSTTFSHTNHTLLTHNIYFLTPHSFPSIPTLTTHSWHTSSPTVSPASSGKLGPFVGDVFQDLDATQSIIRNVLKIKFPKIDGALFANQRIKDPYTWEIEFDRWTIDTHTNNWHPY